MPSAPIAPRPNDAAPESTRSRWQRLVAFLVRYRVRISVVVFFALIAEDVYEGLRPHRITNLWDPMSMLGLTLILTGLTLRTWAAGILHKCREVTRRGPYALIRHPLYVGSFLMMAGFCALIDDAENIWFILGPFALLYVLKILDEEQQLSLKFHLQWHEYAAAVPRLLPRRIPRCSVVGWNGGQWWRNREYQAVVATVLGLLAIESWAVLP